MNEDVVRIIIIIMHNYYAYPLDRLRSFEIDHLYLLILNE